MISRIMPPPAPPPEAKILADVQGTIELRNVYFSYPSSPDIPILSGLYLTIPARKTVALVGSNGSGKSSVISLIERFYDPTLGAGILKSLLPGKLTFPGNLLQFSIDLSGKF